MAEEKREHPKKSLLEYSDVLNKPQESGIYDSEALNYLPVAPHWHYYMEILFVTEGKITVENDGTTLVAEKGDLVMIRPEAVHAILQATKEHTVYRFLKFDASKVGTSSAYVPKLDVILRKGAGSRSAPMLLPCEKIRAFHFGEQIERMYDELVEMQYGYDLIVQGYLSLMIVKILRVWRDMGVDLDGAIAEDTGDLSIHNITGYIDDHAGAELRVEMLADLCNMSYSYFAKSFHNLYGRSCKEYIEHIRISKAEQMLLFTDCDLSYISQETGFADSSHLIKTFRKLKGMTPRQYKIRNQSPTIS